VSGTAGSRFVLALVTAACSSKASKASGGGGGGFQCSNGSIVVGEARAETGDFAFFDVASENGNLLKIDQFNEAGGLNGCKIKVVRGDTKGDPALGGRVAQSLIDQGAKILFSMGRSCAQCPTPGFVTW